MKELNVFLKALSNVFKSGSLKRGQYIPTLKITPSKFGAIKTYELEVWLVDGDTKERISFSSRTERSVSPEEDLAIRENIVIETIENILKRYGL